MDAFVTSQFVLIERLSFLWKVKCTSIIEKGPQSVSFIERFSIVAFIGGSTVA